MRKLATAMAVSLALASTGAQALGLGDIEMHSALNQPLDADIGLNSVQPGELEGLLVQLASREAFERAGIERSPALTALNFSVDRKADGTAYIKVGSSGPVVEPFLNFLLEVDWPKGRMVREYTILLDPPVFMNQEVVSSGASTVVPEVPTQASVEQDLAVPVAIERATDELAEEPIEVVIGDEAQTEITDNEIIVSGDDTAIAEEVIIDSITISSDTEVEVKSETPTETIVTAQAPEASAPAAPTVAQSEYFLLDGVRTTSTDIPVAKTFPLEEEVAAAEVEVEVATTGSTEEVSDVAATGSDQEQANVGSSAGRTEFESASAEGESYLVNRNDTLWQIAANAKPTDVTVQQMMLALLQTNQEAFVDNNVNRLKEGAILRMPSYDEITVRDRQQAVAEMTEQNSLWQEYRDNIGRVATSTSPEPADTAPEAEAPPTPTVAEKVDTLAEKAAEDTAEVAEDTAEAVESAGDELKIVADPATTDSSATANADESKQPENAILGQINTDLTLANEELEAENLQKEELQAQASEIEENKEKMERLIELRESELAQLQERLSTAETTAAEAAEAARLEAEAEAARLEAEAAAAETARLEAEAEAAEQAEAAADEAAVEASDEVVATVEPEPVAVPPVVVEPPQEQSFIQKLMADPAKAAGVGLGALGLLGLLGWLLTRGRKEEEVVVAEPEAFIEDDDASEAQTEFQEVAGAAEDEISEFVEDDEPTELAEIIEGDDTGIEGLDDTGLLSGAVDDESSKDDTISEADVYLAYGLHGQAEDLLTKAVDREPQNQDYLLKLIETHHGQKNPESFASAAQNFHTSFGGDSNPEWTRIAEMGREIDPSNELYADKGGSSSAGMVAGATAAVAGLGAAADAFTGSETDSTLAMDGFEGTGDVTEIIAPPGEDEAAAKLQDDSLLDHSVDPGLAFDEADLEATGDFSKIADELNEETTDFGLDADVLDASALLDGDSLLDEASLELDGDLSLDNASSVEGVSSEQIAASSDELSSLLDELNGDGVEESGSARVLSAANDVADLEPMNETISGLEDTGLDFEESVLDLSAIGDDNLSADGLEGLELTGSPEELTLDLEDLGGDVAADSSVESMFDHTETLDTAFDQTQELEIPDLTANTDLTGSDDSASFGGTNEMETMLDLAKAYIDMGDNDSASSALNEIVKGGTEDQKNTAEELLKKIG